MLGVALSSIRENSRQASQDDEVRQIANDTLSDFQELSELQLHSFVQRVKINRDGFQLPSQSVVSKNTLVRYNVLASAQDITSEIRSNYSHYADPDFASAIGVVLSKNLAALLASTPASSKEAPRTFLAVGSNGSLVRIDIQLYARVFNSAQLMQVARNVAILSIVISSVDSARASEEELKAAARGCYGGVDKDINKRIIEKLVAARKRNVKAR